MNVPKTYDPAQHEAEIYKLWQSARVFEPSDAPKTYSIVMPPPNANANLHIGYELTAVLEDIAARYHRLRGEATLLLPGADHAGFETQVVYEKHLAKEGKSRFDFSREELYQQIWQFVAANRENFRAQLARMGVGCDWSRFSFTLDPHIVSRAYSTFHKMWDEGLIYRGERLVNFCTFHGTAFADIEVVYSEETGKLWFIRYDASDGSGSLTVATTRPETMFGDTAVAVHPDDPRYQALIGKMVRLPLTDREIPVIADDFVDKTFGTGAVKLTPAHDPNDYEAGVRHNLPRITVIGTDGTLQNVPPAFAGLKVQAGREAVAAALQANGHLERTEEHQHNVGHCYKCGTVIEPLLKDQWFVHMQPLAEQAIAALRADKITFYPAAKQDQLIGYLENLRDWNISRQIAWGIPIPAFQNVDDPDDWVYDERVEQGTIELNGKTYRRDPDVFDTWFSSSSWPYATLRHPEHDDFKRFYPLSLMETGGEILYPWVSRMLMLGLYNTGEVPFTSVYIHGYVMAEDGAKMSKSVGNVVDPTPVIDQYGSDALRMGIISSRAPAVNRGYDPRKVEDARNFCNKLWNVARFIESKTDDNTAAEPSTADHWILYKLQHSSETIAASLDRYDFAEAYDTLYHFVWDDFADWYVEAAKVEGSGTVLRSVLEHTLILAHPFAPFVTEAIWQTLDGRQGTILAVQAWPDIEAADQAQAERFSAAQSVVSHARYLSKLFGAIRPGVTYDAADSRLQGQEELITRLARLGSVTPAAAGSEQGIPLTGAAVTCWLHIDSATAERYAADLVSRLEKARQSVTQLRGRLSNSGYIANAPAALVAETQAQLQAAEQLVDELLADQQRLQHT